MREKPIDVHIHLHTVNEDKLDTIIENQEKLMSKADELKAELVEANEVTNELAADVDDLLKRMAEGGLSPTETEEVKAQLAALKEKLKGVAALHTPVASPGPTS